MVHRSRPRLVRRTVLVILIAMVLLLAAPAVADAGCGGVRESQPPAGRWKGYRPPLALGDSTMLLALPDLAKAGFRANARGCRQMTEGLDVIRQVKRRGRLPHMVVIALGADASIEPDQILAALELVGPERVLVLVTPRETGGGSSNDAVVVRRAGRKHPKRIVVLDWVKHSRGKRGWFQPDGLHLTFKGASRFASFLARAMPYAPPHNFPGDVAPPPGDPTQPGASPGTDPPSTPGGS